MGHEIKSGLAGGIAGFIAGRLSRKDNIDARQPSYVHSYDIEGKEEYEKCFMLAQANLESAIAICSSFMSGEDALSWPHASVILSLKYHAYELFYKAAILKGKSEFKSTHRIDKLTDKYLETYSDPKYRVPSAFIFKDMTRSTTSKEKKQAAQARSEQYNKLDQHFRYPFDRPGFPWDIIRAFDLKTGLKELQKDQAAFARVIPLIMSNKNKS